MSLTRYLTDRGIRQAIKRGLIRFEPGVEDRCIQPASLDVFLDSVSASYPHNGFQPLQDWECPNNNLTIPVRSENILATTQQFTFDFPIVPVYELRSSLRRIGCFSPTYGVPMSLGKNVLHLEAHNSSDIEIYLGERAKIGQLMFKMVKPQCSSYRESSIAGFEFDSAMWERALTLDHGYVVDNKEEILKLLKDGYFSTPGSNPSFYGSLLTVHAGKAAQVLRGKVRVDFQGDKDLSDYIEQVNLPYTVKPGEYVMIDTRENLCLSPHIGMRFVDNLNGTPPGDRLNPTFEIKLLNMSEGWVDPGYDGCFSRQPRTFQRAGHTISEGDVLGHGVLIYFPNGVQRPYGSKGLGSHYQNKTSTILTQGQARRQA